MEPQVGVKLSSEAPNYGVKYSVFIGDDDSSTIAKIQEEVDYNVERWSDTAHATRTLVSHLHKISAQKQSCPGESPLSPKVIEYFKKCFSYFLNQNKGEPQKLKISLAAIVPHAFGDYRQCKDNNLSWCMWHKNVILTLTKKWKMHLPKSMKVSTAQLVPRYRRFVFTEEGKVQITE